MSGKRQAEDLDDVSPAKKQKLGNGAASNGVPVPAPTSTASMMEKIAKAKKVLEMQKALKEKLAAANVKVSFGYACVADHSTCVCVYTFCTLPLLSLQLPHNPCSLQLAGAPLHCACHPVDAMRFAADSEGLPEPLHLTVKSLTSL